MEIAPSVEKEAKEEDFLKIVYKNTADVKKQKKDQKAFRKKHRLVLIGAVADSHRKYIKDKRDPKRIWDGLHGVFELDLKNFTNLLKTC